MARSGENALGSTFETIWINIEINDSVMFLRCIRARIDWIHCEEKYRGSFSRQCSPDWTNLMTVVALIRFRLTAIPD